MESGATSYPYPQQVSEVNSLWSIEQCRQGKSAKWIRNFGTRIGSKGRGRRVGVAKVGRASTPGRDKAGFELASRRGRLGLVRVETCPGKGLPLDALRL